MTGRARAFVLRNDARDLPLPDASVDLIVTSPPYFGLRSYVDNGVHYTGQIGSEATPAEWLAAMLDCTREWMRVLKPSGSIFVNLGDKYAGGGGFAAAAPSNHGKPRRNLAGRQPTPGVRDKSLLGLPWRYALACMDDLGLILRRDIIWNKPNGLPESVTDRCRSSHEYLFHLVKQPRYYAAIDEIRENYSPNKPYGRRTKGASMNGGMASGSAATVLHWADTENPLGKLPGSVWEIPSQPLTVPDWLGVDHFAAFPMELPRRIILGWSPPDGVVVDPFGGTGTTALVASVLGRIGYSFDLSADYCRLARWRTRDPGERAKALGVPKPPPVMDGQGDLFEAVS